MHEHKEKDLPSLKQFQMFIYDTIHAEWLIDKKNYIITITI